MGLIEFLVNKVIWVAPDKLNSFLS